MHVSAHWSASQHSAFTPSALQSLSFPHACPRSAGSNATPVSAFPVLDEEMVRPVEDELDEVVAPDTAPVPELVCSIPEDVAPDPDTESAPDVDPTPTPSLEDPAEATPCDPLDVASPDADGSYFGLDARQPTMSPSGTSASKRPIGDYGRHTAGRSSW